MKFLNDFLAVHMGGRRATLQAVRSGLRHGSQHPWLRGYPSVQGARWIFVCKGNICRSPFGEYVSRRHGIESASLGLEADGVAADPIGTNVARQHFQVDMSPHRSRNIAEYAPSARDVVFAFEPEQRRVLLEIIGRRSQFRLPVYLIGSYDACFLPYLHDPFGLSESYFTTCYRRIARAIDRIVAARGPVTN